MLLGGDAGERLEPVGVVGRPVLDGPFLHRLGDGIRNRGLQLVAFGHHFPHALVDGLRQALPHHAVAEYIFTEQFRNVYPFAFFFHWFLLVCK